MNRSNALSFLFVAIVLFVAKSAFAQVRYTVSLADPARHLVQISAEIPPGADEHELQLPVWNALYQVRDFSQYMNWIRAEDTSGHSIPLQQMNKSRWKISGASHGGRILYEMRADNPGPYGSQLNLHHAFFNLAEILLYCDDLRGDRTLIQFLNIPAPWKVATSLAHAGDRYLADTYDDLVDAPVEIGTFAETSFTAACGSYRVVLDSDDAAIMNKIVPTVQRIVSAATDWMKDCPFQQYLFIYRLSDSAGGGMEHAFSTAITIPGKAVVEDPERFASITAHEFFHLWNVKRIRPQSLEPIDYTKENYTPSLWFSEGVDSTVSNYIELRAGLLDERHFIDHLGEEISQLENRPAHLTQSVEQSSVNAWLEKYPYYNLPGRSISYYNKGELLGVLLDLSMQDASNGHASLRQLFQWMNDHYAKQGKFFADSDAVRQAAENLSHADLREFFRRYVSGVDEIPWDRFFAPVGLRLVKSDVTLADPGFDAVQKFDQAPIVVELHSGGQAEQAGLRPGDVILQINGQPAGRGFEAEIARLGAGNTLHVLVRSEIDGRQQQLQWRLEGATRSVFHLEDVPDITAQQKSRRATWLFADDATSPQRSSPALPKPQKPQESQKPQKSQ